MNTSFAAHGALPDGQYRANHWNAARRCSTANGNADTATHPIRSRSWESVRYCSGGSQTLGRASRRFSICSGSVRRLHYINLFAEAFVLLAMKERRHEAAACLLGYTSRNAATSGLTILKDETMIEARAVLDEALDSATLRRLMTAGQSLSPEEVCDLALATSDVDDSGKAAIE